MRTPRRRILVRAGLGLFAVAVLLQLVPYGRDHTNPPVTQDAPWPDGRARELATTACYRLPQQPDPVAAAELRRAVLLDGDPRRRAGPRGAQLLHLGQDDGEADDAAEEVADAEMPPRRYLLVHPDAALSDAERQVLVEALEAMDRARAAATAAGRRRGRRRGPSGRDGG